MGGLPSLRGRPMLIFMGDKDSRLSGYQTLDRMGKAAGIDMKFLVFEGFGHELPQQYVPQITAWLHEHVTYRGLTDTVNAMQRALRSRAWPQAFASAQEVLAVAEPSMDEYAAARDALEKLKATGEDEARTLLSGRPTVNAMKQFVRNWPGLECAKEVIERCDAEGAASLDRILAAGPVSALAVKKFIDDWEGFPVRKRALAAYDEIARAALQRIPTGGMANVRIRNLERFVEQWQVGSAVEEAKAQIRKEQEAVALKELAIIKKTLPIASRGTMLVRFINKYGQQECAAEARSLLEEAASDILERIKAIPNAASRNANLQTFVGIYADTAAGREAAGLIAGGGK